MQSHDFNIVFIGSTLPRCYDFSGLIVGRASSLLYVAFFAEIVITEEAVEPIVALARHLRKAEAGHFVTGELERGKVFIEKNTC